MDLLDLFRRNTRHPQSDAARDAVVPQDDRQSADDWRRPPGILLLVSRAGAGPRDPYPAREAQIGDPPANPTASVPSPPRQSGDYAIAPQPGGGHVLDDLIVLFTGNAQARGRLVSRRAAILKHMAECEDCQIELAAMLEAGSRAQTLSTGQRAQLKSLYDRLARAMYGPHLDEARPLYERYVALWIDQGRRPDASTAPAELAPVMRHLARHSQCDETVRRLYSAHMAARVRAALENAAGSVAAGAIQQPLPLEVVATEADADTPAAELHWRELAYQENPVVVQSGMRLTDYETYDIEVEHQAEGALTLVVWGRDRLHDNRRRTLKLLRPEYHGDAELRAAFVNVALEWCRVAPYGVRHAAPQLVSVPVFNDAPAILVSYAPRTLAGALEAAHSGRHPLTLAQAFGWAQQIAAALVALHRQKRPDGVTPYTHGDLKPENILIDDESAAWLSDVGMHAVWASARSIGSPRVHALPRGPRGANTARDEGDAEAELLLVRPRVGSRGPVVGTPRYMAPERWLGVDAAGPASDVYALGIVLFELFAGIAGGPFMPHPHSAAGWFAAHETGPSCVLPAAEALTRGPLARTLDDDGSGLSVAERESRARMIVGQLDGLIHRCLDPNPGDRPTAADVLSRLGELAGRLGLEREPEPPAEAEALRADDPEHVHRLARSHGRAGQPAAQSDLLLDILPHVPSPDLWISLGSALYDQGFAALALRAYDAAGSLMPALAHDRQPEQQAAAPASAQAKILAFHRANAYLRLGRHDEAVRAYDEALAHQRDYLPALWGATAAHHRIAAAASDLDTRRDQLRRADERARVARSYTRGTPHPKVRDLHERIQRDCSSVRREQYASSE